MNKNIAIIGPESSGKTTLAQKLARDFNGVATKEYARTYFKVKQLPANHTLSTQEMREVMAGQRAAEEEGGLCFIDAGTIHGPLYAALTHTESGDLAFDYSRVDARVMEYATENLYDAFIICHPHSALAWEDDGVRAMPDLGDRHAFAAACHAFIAEHDGQKPVIVIDKDNWPARVVQAKEHVKTLLTREARK